MRASMSVRLRVTTAALVAVLLLALGAAAWGQWWLHDQRHSEGRAAAAKKAADTAVAAMLSYDYRRLQDDMRQTATLLTGDARSQYTDLETPLLTSAPTLHAVMQATVKTSTVLRSDDSSAQVLLFVDQLASSTKLDKPQLDESRIVVTMKRTGGRWLVSSLAAV